MPFRLVLKNLFKHPLRTVLTLGSLIVALFLLCVLRSLVVTLEAGVKAARSDRIIVQSAVSLFVQLPESYEAKIVGVEGVRAACRWNWFGGYYREPANFFAQFACEPEELFDLYPEIKIVEGSAEEFVSKRLSCIIGTDLVRDFGFRVGDTVPIISALYPLASGGAWEFRVAGIYESSSSAVDQRTLFFHWEYLSESIDQGVTLGPDGVGIFVVGIEKEADPVAVMAAIDELFENGPQRVQATSESEFQAQFVSMIGNVPF
ncbi:MAG TPA: ABC transporter permease, partial [Planctomycetota bacterium]|nr:ABC transporter permease [Planctomycetota bacterium]